MLLHQQYNAIILLMIFDGPSIFFIVLIFKFLDFNITVDKCVKLLFSNFM